jgi:hypothetical protein
MNTCSACRGVRVGLLARLARLAGLVCWLGLVGFARLRRLARLVCLPAKKKHPAAGLEGTNDGKPRMYDPPGNGMENRCRAIAARAVQARAYARFFRRRSPLHCDRRRGRGWPRRVIRPADGMDNRRRAIDQRGETANPLGTIGSNYGCGFPGSVPVDAD